MSHPTLKHLAFSLPVLFLKEKKIFIAYTPALDLSASGKTTAQAKKNFETTLKLFFEELMEAGTLSSVLSDMGWTKQEKKWQPPVEVKTIAFIPMKVSIPI